MKLQQQKHIFSEVLERKEFALGQELLRKWQIFLINDFYELAENGKSKDYFIFFVLLDKFKSSHLKIMFLIQ